MPEVRRRRQWRLPGLVALVVFGVLAIANAPAAADGLIVRGQPGDGSGMQIDAARLSPQPAALARAAAGAQTYVVQPGDTLSAIAARAGLDVAALMARNGLQNPDRLAIGQTLKTGGSVDSQPVLNLPPDGALTGVQLWPWPPRQGQTVAVWLHARAPVTFTAQLDAAAYPVFAQGRHGWALIPIPPLTPPGLHQLVIAAGEQRLVVQIPVQASAFAQINIPAAVADPILAQPAQVQADLARMTALWTIFGADGWTARSRFRLPLAGDTPRTSPYGTRRTYGSDPALSAHAGEDFSAAPGTPVYAPADGTVVLAELMFVRGNAVLIDHGHGVFTGYWHLSKLDVEAGQHVTAGQLLGVVGSTGLSTGAHLHWELRVAGMAVDPLQWVGP